MNGCKETIMRLAGRYSWTLLEFYYFCRYLAGNRGTAHQCPCCGSRLRRFLTASIGSLERVDGILCPRCDSHPRHRLLWLYLEEHCRQFFAEPQRLLHVAPEFCFLRRFRAMPNLCYVSGDLDSPLAGSRFDLMRLPFAAESFDAVFCNHVLEHVEDDCAAMRELFRVLRPGGWGVLQVPVEPGRAVTFEDKSITLPAERTRHFGQHDHVRQYGADYPERLRAAGFAVQIFDYAKDLESHRLKYYGLVPAEAIYLCTRPRGAGMAERG